MTRQPDSNRDHDAPDDSLVMRLRRVVKELAINRAEHSGGDGEFGAFFYRTIEQLKKAEVRAAQKQGVQT